MKDNSLIVMVLCFLTGCAVGLFVRLLCMDFTETEEPDIAPIVNDTVVVRITESIDSIRHEREERKRTHVSETETCPACPDSALLFFERYVSEYRLGKGVDR